MSFVEVPSGTKMPTTSTYERWAKRKRAEAKAIMEANDSPSTKYNLAMRDYNQRVRHLQRVNKFRARRGLAPHSMPSRPTKASFGVKGGVMLNG